MYKFRSKHSFNLQHRTEKSTFVTQTYYDLVDSQMNTDIINKQMDFDNAEISSFPFYANTIILSLMFSCYIAFIFH